MSDVRSEPPVVEDLSPFKNLQFDLPAAVVVFLIALPLCLGIAFASGAPVFAGIITGIVGGLIVAPISKSPLSVSGPAAGLTVIVLNGIAELGTYEAFLAAVVISGLLQLVMGFLRAGVIAYYFPSSVVHGMLSGIGIILILKQIPHAIGWDKDSEGDFSFFQADGANTFSEIGNALGGFHWGATIVTLLGLAILVFWPKVPVAALRKFPAALLVVITGVGLKLLFDSVKPDWALEGELLVNLPDVFGNDFALNTPTWSAFARPEAWKVGAVIAIVASVETLLCVEAVDKQDPFGRETPPSHELKAQGIGNMIAGLLGGIPMTAVIVRGSANVASGGRTKASAFFHGVLLLVCVVAIANILNLIPLASLAAVLLFLGYRLMNPKYMKKTLEHGFLVWLPFFATVAGIILMDLLKGVILGLVIGVFFVLKDHATASYFVHDISEEEDEDGDRIRLELSENVSFLNKAALSQYLHSLTSGTFICIDARRSLHIDHDSREIIEEFVRTAPKRGIEVEVIGLVDEEEDHERDVLHIEDH